jgi:hypothetical protein
MDVAHRAVADPAVTDSGLSGDAAIGRRDCQADAGEYRAADRLAVDTSSLVQVAALALTAI